MKYNFKKITGDQIKSSSWSGGTTNEIYIYPEEGDYKARNFKWRISSATVELEESTFTKLPGVHRYITTLSGDLKLVHNGEKETVLRPYDINSFSGEIETRSFGKVTDFNLMLNEGIKGFMETLVVEENLLKELPLRENDNGEFSIFIFSPLDDITLKVEEEESDIKSGETIIIHGLNKEIHEKIKLISNGFTKVIYGIIYS